jgi:hypothetical protein
MDWITCPSCEEEFKLITESIDPPLFCPYCGEDLPDGLEDLYDEDQDYDD